jgi:hypothetical protein
MTSASRYLQQLCKHWAHRLPVELSFDQGNVTFPKDLRGADDPGDARVTFYSLENALRIEIQATSMDQLERLKDVVARHLDRFAFREAPLAFNWRPAVLPVQG